MGAFFLVCFFFGAVMSLLSLLTGAAHLALPGTHALHLGHDLHLGHGHSSTRPGAPVFNLGSLLAFLTWFGGVGYLLLTLSPLALVLVLLLSLVAGVSAGALILVFLVKVLLPAQTKLDPAAYQLDGTPARVTAGIPDGGVGEITYSKAGTRRSDAARSIDGKPMSHGDEVVILAYRRGIAYVQSLNKYLSSSATSIAEQLVALEDGPSSNDLLSRTDAKGAEKKRIDQE